MNATLPLAPGEVARRLVVFVPAFSIDPLMIAEGYYLQASGQVAAKPYVLLRKALERSSKVAVAKYAWSGRERLGLLRVRDTAIVLHAMRWPDEIRDPSSLAPGAVELDEDEVAGAQALIDSVTRDEIEGAEFAVDRYTEALEQVIEAKLEQREPPAAPESTRPTGRVSWSTCRAGPSPSTSSGPWGSGQPQPPAGRSRASPAACRRPTAAPTASPTSTGATPSATTGCGASTAAAKAPPTRWPR